MHILMISDVYFPRINGVSTSIRTFITELNEQGHRVTLIAPNYHERETVFERTPLGDVIRIASRHVPFDKEDRFMQFSQITQIIEQLKLKEIDLIHIQTPFIAHYAGVNLSKHLQIPCVSTYHTLFEEYLYHYIPILPKSFWRFFARRFSSHQCNQVNAVIAPSSCVTQLLKNYGVQTDITVIPTGVDIKKYARTGKTTFRKDFNIPENKKICLNVSRIAFEKNIGFLLNVIQSVKKSCPEILLIIAGEGPAKKHYIHQVEKMDLQDNILFTGYLDHDTDLINGYHFSDVFLFSSKTETQGLVLLEAMACGLPIVSIAEMGTLDILKDSEAALISPEDVEYFSQLVLDLLNDPKQHAHLKLAAKSHALQWDTQQLTKKMSVFYNERLSKYHVK